MNKHANSRPIVIYRSGSFLSRVQGKEVEDYFELAVVSVGSFWEGEFSVKVATGLDYEEQTLLLPHIVNCEADEKGFRQMVEIFYHEINTKIPFKIGVTLETGLKVDNNAPLSIKNMPINVSDYVKWRHHRTHPKMANSKEEAEGNQLKEYYIFDPNAASTARSKVSKQKDAALQIYLKLKNEPEKIDMMLLLLGHDPREFTGPTKDDLKLNKLREIADGVDTAEMFTNIYAQEDMEISYWIENMIRLNVLTRIGQQVRDTETKKLIGHNRSEAISFFQDPTNDSDVVILKAKLQEVKSKPLQVGAKVTELTSKQAYTVK